ncbi:MAG TPA: glycine cleavage T C-terminal barrel domain-containing protein, partial [Tardiphaga sp.]
GYELHMPTEFAATVYDALMQAGAEFDIANVGYRALETMRLEKAYWASGSDVGPDHSPFEAGLGWAVKFDTDIPFLGRAALEAKQGQPLKKRLAGFTVDDPTIILLGRETIYRNGERVGWLSSAGFGHTVGKPIGYGYVRQPEGGLDEAFVLSGSYELEVAMERVPARVHLGALYDPDMKNMLC